MNGLETVKSSACGLLRDHARGGHGADNKKPAASPDLGSRREAGLLRTRNRLLFLILFATLIPALAAGVQFLVRRDADIAAARQDLAAAARQVARDLTDTIRATAQLHYGLSRARDLDTPDRAACSAFLANVLNEYPQYTGILTIQPNGELFCDSLHSGRTLNLTDRQYFQDALNSKNPLAVEPVFGRLTGIAVLQVAYAARRETGEPNFVLLASLNLEKTMRSHSQILPRRNAVIALVDGKGTVLTWDPDGDKLRGTSIADSPLFRFARDPQGEEVRENIEFGGTSQIWAASALPQFAAAGLHVLVGASKENLLAAANRNLVQALATLLAVWLLVSAGAWILARGAMGRELAEGERIRKLNERLEQRVLERTAELSLANSSLSREIEERRRSERTARESEDQLNQAQQLAHLGYIHIDLFTKKAAWSDETYRIFGVSRETFTPSMDNYLQMVHPDDQAAVRSVQELVRQGINPKAMEYRIVRPDGSVRQIYRESALVGDEAGIPQRLVSTLHDITERRQTEEQLRQAQKMEAIGNLTGGMAHDFNNLLGIIIGNLDLLRDRQTGDPDADELTGEALEAALRGADLTRRLLAFARRQPLQPTRTEVNELIAGIVRLLERTLGEQVKITLDLDPDTWPVVIDPVQLESSLANLANNARDAMPRGGELIIVTGNRSLDADYASLHAELQPGDYAVIEVSDTGTGMPPKVMNHVFEPFYTTKEPDKGTGLGLSMVFGFMKQSGGHINVYSEVGIGTTFRLYLPRADSDAEPGRPAAVAAVLRGNGETVLAVEDNPSLRRVVVRQLTELGYRVLEAEDAQTALQVLESEPVDLLFTDIVMPGGTSGYEIARTVQSRWPSIRVVLTSGFPETKINGDAGARNLRLLSKPYRRDDLGRLIREVLDS